MSCVLRKGVGQSQKKVHAKSSTHHFATIASASPVTSSARDAMSFSFHQWRADFQTSLLPRLSLQEKSAVLETLVASCSIREKEMLFGVWHGCLCVDFIVALPPALSAAVLRLLDLASLLCCTRVCRAWYNIVTDAKRVWTRYASRLVWSLTQEHVTPHPYQHFLRAGQHVKWLRDTVFGRVRVTVPSWVEGAGRASSRYQLWGCGPDKLCIEWYRIDGWLKVVEGLQMWCIGEGGDMSLLWEETLAGELQGCLTASTKSVLMCGAWRSGLVWRSVSTGKEVRGCSDVDLCPLRSTDHVMMCPTCCSVSVAMAREDPGDVRVMYLPFDASKPVGRFHCRLEDAILGAGLRGYWDDVAIHQDDVAICEDSVAECRGHHILLQTWSHQFTLFNLTSSGGGMGGALLPVCCLQLQPDLQGPLRGSWMRFCMSSSGREVGLVACGWLVVLSTATLTQLHCVDVRTCCQCLGSPMLQCLALGTAFAVLGSGQDTSDGKAVSRVCLVSLAGLLLCNVHVVSCAVLNARLLDWPAPLSHVCACAILEDCGRTIS